MAPDWIWKAFKESELDIITEYCLVWKLERVLFCGGVFVSAFASSTLPIKTWNWKTHTWDTGTAFVGVCHHLVALEDRKESGRINNKLKKKEKKVSCLQFKTSLSYDDFK